jgi:hypothetical protein
MTTYYRVIATSPSTNESIQSVSLEGNPSTDPVYAQQLADAFAQLLNKNAKLNATDWYGRIEANPTHNQIR